MARFTTRPELSGTFGMVSSTHWIATAVGMGVLERGGNAFDAAAAMGFVLHVVEPHLNGPLGDMPALVWPASETAPTVICGQGTAPENATISYYRKEGLDLIPGSGLLATVIPGAFDAWMLIVRDYGTLDIADVLSHAIRYAHAGHPLLGAAASTISAMAGFFREEWPTSAEVWLPGGEAPQAGQLFVNRQLAATWMQLLAEISMVRGHEARAEAARRIFYKGFISEHIDNYLKTACVMDATGERRKGVLTGNDLANWQASREAAISLDYQGWRVFKCGAWTQGPALLQSLAILDGVDMTSMSAESSDFVHWVTEAIKLAMADREAYYGDPSDADVPLAALLSKKYAAQRRSLIGPQASLDFMAGSVAGLERQVAAAERRFRAYRQDISGSALGEPTMAHLSARRGDTVHLDVVDQWGNMISATPSGGWLQSSPIVPGLGMPLNSRAQMFWLEEGLPTSLAPGRRPRTTLTPSMALGPGFERLAFGTPGGDQQEQWQASFLLRLIHHRMNMQEAIDAPLFHTGHLQSSFFPRTFKQGHLLVEPSFGEETIDDLRSRGHRLEVSAPWAAGRLTAVMRQADGLLRGAATPRLMQAYAAGR